MTIAEALKSATRRPSLIAATAAAVLTAVLTRRGLLLDPDSPTYLRTSRWIRDDPGMFFDPPVGTMLSIRGLFPPLYAGVLSLVGVIGDDLVMAKWLGIALAAMAIGLFTNVVAAQTSSVTALLAAVTIMVSRGYLLVLFGFLMSDGLHVVLMLATLSALVPMLRSGPSAPTTGRAVLVGALAAAGACTRYVGVGLVIGAVLAIGLLGAAPLRRRLVLAATALVVGLAPPGIWSLIVASNGPAGQRSVGFHPLSYQDRDVFEVVPYAFLPRPAIDRLGSDTLVVIGSMLMLAVALWTVERVVAAVREPDDLPQRVCAAIAVFGWTYVAVLLAGRLGFDRLVALSGRHALPWMTCLVAAVAIDVHRRVHRRRVNSVRRGPSRSARQRLAVAAVAALVIGAGPAFARSLVEPGGSWWNLGQFPASGLARSVARQPAELLVYTNREDIIYLETGRQTATIPLPIVPYTGRPDPTYRDRVAAIVSEVTSGRAIVVDFTDTGGVWQIRLDDFAGSPAITVIERTAEGVILGAARQS